MPMLRGVAATALSLSVLAGCAAHKIAQTYYLGVFDPQEQIPQSLYRVRVLGTSEWFSNVNYAAGWVPAALVDSLGSRIEFDRDTGDVKLTSAESDPTSTLSTDRRLMLFGPEGFREAPRNHRLVILMDSDPSHFFEAIDTALGQLSAAKQLELGDVRNQEAAVQDDRIRALQEQRDLLEVRALEVEQKEGSR